MKNHIHILCIVGMLAMFSVAQPDAVPRDPSPTAPTSPTPPTPKPPKPPSPKPPPPSPPAPPKHITFGTPVT